MDRVRDALSEISAAIGPSSAELIVTPVSVPVSFRVVRPDGVSRLVVRVYGGAHEQPLATTRQVANVIAMVRRRLFERKQLSPA